MNKEKIYVLLKDLPDGSKAGDEYVLENEMIIYAKGVSHSYLIPKRKDKKSLHSWPFNEVEIRAWFKLKKEPKPYVEDIHHEQGHYIYSLSNDFINHQISKERLAELLIAEQDDNILIGKKIGIYPERFIGTDMIYTERDLLKAKEEGFNAAREIDFSGKYCCAVSKHKTFSDFMNSINDK